MLRQKFHQNNTKKTGHLFFGGLLLALVLALPVFGLVGYLLAASSGSVNLSGLVETHGECFLPGTKILLADGQQKNIEDLKNGEEVLTYNEATHRLEAGKIKTRFISYDVEKYLVINRRLKPVKLNLVTNCLTATVGWKKLFLCSW